MNHLYTLLIFIHVLSMVLSVGPLFVLFAVLNRMKSANLSEEKGYIAIFRSIVRLIKHAGHVLVGSGILLVILGPWPWSTPWLVTTIALMVFSIIFLARAFSGTLKKFEDAVANRNILINKLTTSTWIYIVLLVLMLALMVIKPSLWLA